jgi:hypothetical protein
MRGRRAAAGCGSWSTPRGGRAGEVSSRIRGHGPVRGRVSGQGAPGPPEPEFEALLRRGPCWAVLDGYHFGPDYQRAAGLTGAMTLVATTACITTATTPTSCSTRTSTPTRSPIRPLRGAPLGPRFARYAGSSGRGHPRAPSRPGRARCWSPSAARTRTMCRSDRGGPAASWPCGPADHGPLRRAHPRAAEPGDRGGEAGVRRETGVRDMAANGWADLAVTAAGSPASRRPPWGLRA